MRVYYLPNWDGLHSAVVAAANQELACKLLRSSENGFRNYGGRRVDHLDGANYAEMCRIATGVPGRVFKRLINHTREVMPWMAC